MRVMSIYMQMDLEVSVGLHFLTDNCKEVVHNKDKESV